MGSRSKQITNMDGMVLAEGWIGQLLNHLVIEKGRGKYGSIFNLASLLRVTTLYVQRIKIWKRM